jgi:replicative DNA helicase
MQEKKKKKVETPLGDLRLEEEALGGMMADPRAVAAATAVGLGPEHFDSPANAAVAAAALRSWKERGTAGLFAVVGILQDAGDLDAAGGVQRLRDLVAGATPAYASDAARRLVEYAKRRRCARIGADLEAGAKGGVDSGLATSEAMRRIACVGREHAVGADINELAAKRCEWVEAVREGREEDRSIFFDYYDLDKILCGLRRGSFVPLAGFTSVGKTALALNIARKLCKQGLNVTIFSLELTKEDQTERLISIESGVNYNDIIHPAHMSDIGWNDVAAAKRRIAEYPGRLDVIYEPSMTTLDMWTTLTAARHLGIPVDMAIIDYLQIATPGAKKRYTSRENEVSTIAEESRRLAKDLDCVCLALCQVNDAVVGRKTPKIFISDIRESKAIGKHSDATLLMYYPDWEEKPKTRSKMVIDVAKHNSGPTGECTMIFDKAHMKFENHTDEDLPDWITDDT